MELELKQFYDGDVIRSEMSHGGYGWVIYIRHRGRSKLAMLTITKILLNEGSIVQAGDVIAKVGNSGEALDLIFILN